MAILPEELAPGVYRVQALAIPDAISVFLIRSEDGWTLVDTGLAESVERIRMALIALGAGPDDLRRIYLTHQHADHIEGAPGMRRWAPGAAIIAPARDAKVIAGERVPDPFSNPLLRFVQLWQQMPAVPVDRVVREGERVAGFRVIATPGHTPGHTSLLSDEHGVLITGDAFGCMPKALRVGVRAGLCTDPAEATRSAEKLLGEEYAIAALSHGPVLRDNAKEQLRQATAACDWAGTE